MYTIGQMSQLCHVSARMLRYFEDKGLLQPVFVGENGYRYYTAEQLVDIAAIVRLQGYDFTLAEIRRFLVADEADQLQMLQTQREKNQRRLQSLRKSVHALTEDIQRWEGVELKKEHEPIIVMEDPAQQVFGLKRQVRPENIHGLFAELYDEMAKRGLRRVGAAQLVYLDEAYNEELLNVEAQVQVTGEHPDVQMRKPQLCAVCHYQGAYEQIATAYEMMGQWLAAHPEYRVVGPVVERFLHDEHEVQTTDDLMTGLLFPVALTE